MYLKLSVAGHFKIFLTRTRGPFWSIRPARFCWMAVFGTQILATLIAVYGLLMPPIGWGWALVSVGLFPGLVPCERPGETARISDFRSFSGEKNMNEIGMVGLGVMGRNLVLNIADRGFSVAGYDKDQAKSRRCARRQRSGRSAPRGI